MRLLWAVSRLNRGSAAQPGAARGRPCVGRMPMASFVRRAPPCYVLRSNNSPTPSLQSLSPSLPFPRLAAAVVSSSLPFGYRVLLSTEPTGTLTGPQRPLATPPLRPATVPWQHRTLLACLPGKLHAFFLPLCPVGDPRKWPQATGRGL